MAETGQECGFLFLRASLPPSGGRVPDQLIDAIPMILVTRHALTILSRRASLFLYSNQHRTRRKLRRSFPPTGCIIPVEAHEAFT